MIRFATMEDKALIESICNCPDIRKWTAFDGASPCVADRYLNSRSMTILADAGCFLLHFIDAGRYVVHPNLLPTMRGKNALRAAKEAMELVFCTTDCTDLMAMVPVNNPQAKWFAKAMGFRYLFTRKEIWPCGGEKYDMEFFSLSVDDWILQGSCASEGHKFHEFLRSMQRNFVNHLHDDAHNNYVGAIVKMMIHGQAKKAAMIYNRWAKFAGYVPVIVISDSPLRVNIKTCILKFDNGEITVEEGEKNA